MKSGACPKCQSKDLILIEEATVPDHESSNTVHPASLASHYGPSGEMGWMGEKLARTSVGFSVYVCGACAYSEIYARDLDRLREYARSRSANVRPV